MTTGARRPRVVHLGPDPTGPGGMPAVVRGLLASPLRAHLDQDVIATYRPGPWWRRHLIFLRALPRLAAWCLAPGPRIVHVHTAVRGSLYRKAIVVALARALRRPVLLHLHAGVGDIATFAEGLSPWRMRLLRRPFDRASAVISVSRAGAVEIERRFGARDVQVVPNAAPAVPATPLPDRPPDDPVRLLYLGGFEDPAKGGAVMAEALGGLPSLDVDVVLAGPGEPPPAVTAATSGGRARWLGWLDEPAKHAAYGQADIVVFPSITEGLPVALLEAMAYGRAIVASRAGGMPEVLTDAQDALLVPVGDVAALVDAITRLAADGTLRGRLGDAARSRARRLNDDEVTGRLLALYDAALGTRGRR
jgi:glycosyltransferase involved in cell wall biosynthesis